jgi:ubiquinone/menaquinone biosynthesis C-methylase UbiE
LDIARVGKALESVKKEKPDIADHLSESKFFARLSKYYALVPSAVLIRTAEAELLHSVQLVQTTLDLCCGDGFFASLIQPSGFDAGCDRSKPALVNAKQGKIHRFLVCADIGVRIPFVDDYFNTVLSNSSLEHVKEIDSALKEISRVLKPGGKLYTTFGSDFAYSWWPCGEKALKQYLQYQPVYNKFSVEEWSERMFNAGLKIVGHQYYLSKKATKLMTFLDYHFSRVYMTTDRTVARPIVRLMRTLPPGLWTSVWKRAFGRVQILSAENGGGILIVAEKSPHKV